MTIKLEDIFIERTGYGSLEFNVELYDHTFSQDDKDRIKKIAETPISNDNQFLDLGSVFNYLNDSSAGDIFDDKKTEIHKAVYFSTTDGDYNIKVTIGEVETNIKLAHDIWSKTFSTDATAEIAGDSYH